MTTKEQTTATTTAAAQRYRICRLFKELQEPLVREADFTDK